MNGNLFTVLLVEDNLAHKTLIVRHFNNMRKRFVHVADGEAALDYLFHRGQYTNQTKNPLPDLILLDLKLPKLDGMEVLQEVRSRDEFSQIPVVMLTTSAQKSDREMAFRYHVNSYLVKPTDPEKFISLMKSTATYWLKSNLAWEHLN